MALKLPLEELQQVQQMLNRVPMLRSLAQKEVEELAFMFTRRHFTRGTKIIKQGDPGKSFHLISRGRVGVHRGGLLRKKKIAELGPGDFFGEIALIENVPRTASIIAEEDGEMYTLTRDSFEQLLLSNPRIGEAIRETSRRRQDSDSNTDLE